MQNGVTLAVPGYDMQTLVCRLFFLLTVDIYHKSRPALAWSFDKLNFLHPDQLQVTAGGSVPITEMSVDIGETPNT